MATLTFDAARNRLKRLAAADNDPALAEADIDDILENAKVPDRFGVLPVFAGWESTYDMDKAAADAWETKAAKASGMHDFSADGASFSVSQVIAHCQKQAETYRARMVASSGGYNQSSGQVVNG